MSANAIGSEDLAALFKPLSNMQETYSSRREHIISNIKELRVQISESVTDYEREAFEHALKLEIDCLSRLNNDEMQSKRFNEADKMDAIVEAGSVDIEQDA